MAPKKKTRYEEEVDHIYDYLRYGDPMSEGYTTAVANLEKLVDSQNKKNPRVSKETMWQIAAYVGMSLFVVCFEQINVIRSNAWGGIQKLRF